MLDHKKISIILCGLLVAVCQSMAQTVGIDLLKKGKDVPESLYGIFFEEINHAGDGGIYAELVKNRNFEEHVVPSGTVYKDGYAVAPHSLNYEHGGYRDWKIKWDADSLKMDGWSLKGNVKAEVTSENQLDAATPNAIRLEIESPDAILENSGYWGMRIIGNDKYDLRFYVNPIDYSGAVTALIVAQDGHVLANHSFNVAKGDKWQELTAVLTPVTTDYKATLQLLFEETGKIYVDYVSLFPQNTFKGRKNGLRPDIAQKIADLKPGFIRWPGGCIVEGATLENRAKWKETIGDPMKRHSEWILWNYHCSWGFGYHEFLQFCEDVGAAGMFVANVGLSCSVRNGDWTEDYEPFLQDIIDAIDYATAPVSNPWGSMRAAAGHPEPFNLKYVELGNEQVGDHYAQRYNYFYRILKDKYPDMTFISTIQLQPSRDILEHPDMIDPHWYVNAGFFYENDHLFDNMERGKYDIYIGEYAVISEANLNAALAEAAFLTGVERNSDLVKMASYAPLFENVNRRDWPTNLIWYDNEKTMGRASYYVQQMYAANRPTYNVEIDLKEPMRHLTAGRIGFAGSNLADMVRYITVRDAQGKIIAENLDPSVLGIMEKKPQNRWERNTTINILNDIEMEGGSVEFDVRMVERDLPPLPFSPDPKPRRGLVGPAMIFGADDNFDDYFIVNIPYAEGERKIITMNRSTSGSRNFDSNPGGGSLHFDKDQWRNVKVNLGTDNVVTVDIDGEEVFRQLAAAPSGHYFAAGYDENMGEVIIKVVNSTDKPFSPVISLDGGMIAKNGVAITLSSVSRNDENSMDCPDRIRPVETAFNKFGKNFKYTFEPNSFTILRTKAQLNQQ